MTRKHFEIVAKIIKAAIDCPTNDRATVEGLADEFCTMAKRENSNFDRARFRAAAGLE